MKRDTRLINPNPRITRGICQSPVSLRLIRITFHASRFTFHVSRFTFQKGHI
ncbi:hypothetical protein QUF80_16160 [Desulfococcaceae bacterium HSG8]|nr:hypothetical protein [Desulfococcaceae bacterium HSG8]